MKFFFTTLLILLIGGSVFAQRVATAAPTSDFKTVQSGYVETVFTLNEALSSQEVADLLRWAEGNDPHVKLTIDNNGKILVLQLAPDYNQRALYEKTFFQMNIDLIHATVNGVAKTMSIADFFDEIGL